MTTKITTTIDITTSNTIIITTTNTTLMTMFVSTTNVTNTLYSYNF